MAEKKWYVVTTYSGYENKVKEYLERRIESMGLQEIIEQVIVPEVEETTADGKKKMKKIFPGYVLIQMDITDEAWYIVRNTPNVTGFVGSSGGGAKPIPLMDEEIDDILSQMGLSQINVDYAIGDRVEVIEGSFIGTEGVVQSIDLKNSTVEVLLPFFGRETNTELKLNQVRKVQV
ncbi:transcription termination/antitermination protein NusG [Mycoplasma sp. P36-A1]|uniref:transcription termination/antitermination protein NusG n=1 Tax=Mycoplasma sp. P36-A1 TaxID=3252900 RepID=UPI003C2EAC59